MSAPLNLHQAEDATLVQLLWETLENLARDCGQQPPTPSEKLAVLIAEAAGGEHFELRQGLIRVPVAHVEKIHAHFGTDKVDLWPEQDGWRTITLRPFVREIQLRMQRDGLSIMPVPV